MPSPTRSTDLIEMFAERAIYFLFGGVVCLIVWFILWHWRGSGSYDALSHIFLLFGVILVVSSLWGMMQIRTVKFHHVKCPFCNTVNDLTDAPTEDFHCVKCSRMIPIENGEVMSVSQVQCGYCQTLNYYSAKTEILICEECDHEIPISQDEEGRPTKSIPKAFKITDDDALYSLVLTEPGKNSEEMIATLQQMLALNRNQVKDILEGLPATLLTGINRRKAEMLQAQLSIHGATAEISAMEF